MLDEMDAEPYGDYTDAYVIRVRFQLDQNNKDTIIMFMFPVIKANVFLYIPELFALSLYHKIPAPGCYCCLF